MKGLACTACGISVSGLTLGHLSSQLSDMQKAFHIHEIYPKGGCIILFITIDNLHLYFFTIWFLMRKMTMLADKRVTSDIVQFQLLGGKGFLEISRMCPLLLELSRDRIW